MKHRQEGIAPVMVQCSDDEAFSLTIHGISTSASRMAAIAIGLAVAPVAAAAQDQVAQQAPVAEPVQATLPPARFPILAIDVLGASVLPAAEIERTVYPFMGPDRTTADVEAARAAVQEAYTKAGYEAVVVEIPPQPQADFALGLVQIRVTEAPVGKIAVSGSKHHSAEALLRQLPSVQAGQPLNFKQLQHDLEVANRFPDRSVEPSFDAGEQAGTIDVDLKVRDSRPVHASLELNNDNSPNTTDLRLTGSASYSNLWGKGHTASLGFAIAPRRLADSEAYFGSYSLPFAGSDWTLMLSGYKSNSNIAALGGTNVLGNGYQVGLQAIYRLPSGRDYHGFRFGLDYKDFKQNIGISGATISNAPIRYVPLTLGYTFSAAREKASLNIDLNATLGLRVMKRIRCFDPAATAATCRPEDQFTNREVDSFENFAHVNLDATYTRMLAGDWVAELRLAGQFADSHVVSNEQFAIGGLASVRGYYQSEIVGDRGMIGSVELRAPSLATQIGTFVEDLRLFAFMDGGLVSVIDPLPDTQSTFRAVSVGGGLRAKIFGLLSGSALVGLPLRSTTDTRRYDPRFTFLLKGEF